MHGSPLDGTPAASPPPRPRSRSKRVTLASTIVVLGLVAMVLGLVLQQPRLPGTGRPGGIAIPDYRAQATLDDRPAPRFEMPSLHDGTPIALGDLVDRVVILNVWASWCGPCRAEAPELEQAWKSYRERGVRFLGVDYRDNQAAGRAFLEEFGISYPSAFDPSGEIAFDYGLLGLPTTFVIGEDGRIAYKFTGRIDAQTLQTALDDVLMAP